ncbi:unnamed protein product [Brachionus calyciflorus]|uniref:Uncharacterized protein n=1 Tax=Brachionus calyciflorus TaxID=104777 RepID=A0A813NYM1_9BILA|nr:unnamed protein product [Brachionus calyciflorus]
MKKKSLSKEIKKIICDNIESSTSHGFPNIIRNESILVNSMWIICIFISSSYCAYCLIKSFREYFSYEIDTKLIFNRVSQVEFPTVTFCNKIATDFKRDNNEIETLKKGQTESLKDLKDLNNFRDFYTAIDFWFKRFTISVKNIGGFEIEKMLLSCSFNFKQCHASDFKLLNSSTFGFCYQFNANSTHIQKVSSPGKKAGLSLELFIGYNSKKYDFYKSYGAHLFIHNSSTIPSSEFDGISLSTGHETDIIVNEILFKKLPKPHSNCVEDSYSNVSFDSDLYRETIKLFKKYGQKTCLNLCFHKNIFEKCGCYYPDRNIVEDFSQVCDEIIYDKCYMPFISTYGESKASQNCFEKCPDECESVKYNLQISQADFPTEFYADFLMNYDATLKNSSRNFSSYKNVKKSTLAVNVYFDDIGYTLVEEKPSKTLEQLVADIGGLLGLCIGISFLSVAEIFDSILKIILLLFEKRIVQPK